MAAGSIPELAALVVSTVVLGALAHEFSHVVALRIAGLPCRVEPFPDTDSGRLMLGLASGHLASVRPVGVPQGVSTWRLRAAAIAPLCLLAPLGFVALGVLPDPFAGGHSALQLATIAWLGCALPSPADFSILWYPERSLEAARQASSAGG